MREQRCKHLSIADKAEIFTLFTKAQRTYFALVKLVHMYRHKKTPVYNSSDLLMTPIDQYGEGVMRLYQRNRIYLFTVNDICNLFNANLSHSPYFFSDPLPIRNPYNNVYFTKTDLYNFYYFVRGSKRAVPILMELFFRSNFDILHFGRENQYIIREFYIKNYVDTMHKNALLENIYSMLNDHSDIIIHPEFPRDRLIEVMRPYLLLYFKWAYSSCYRSQSKSMERLCNQLRVFKRYNPCFGRKMIKMKKVFEVGKTGAVNPFVGKTGAVNSFLVKRYKPEVYFNDIHIPFNVCTTYFFKNHIERIEYEYEYINEVGHSNDTSSQSSESSSDDEIIVSEIDEEEDFDEY